MNEYTLIYELKEILNESLILGPNNTILHMIEEIVDFPVVILQGKIYIPKDKEDEKDTLMALFALLEQFSFEHISFSAQDIIYIMQNIKEGKLNELKEIYFHRELLITLQNGKPIFPKTAHQALYLKELKSNDIVFGVGPAGTGKTYLAVMYAASLLKKQQIKRILLVRPVVEAGEKLGFLPGDLKEKIDPYLIPLYDALNDCFGKDMVAKMIEKGSIEVAPLAYMRGRTLDHCIAILDEAQNATTTQMKMFLTRLGVESQMIITGDITQIDLPSHHHSGLIEAIHLLKNLPGLSIVQFDKSDVMRHPLVYKIIHRYESKKEE